MAVYAQNMGRIHWVITWKLALLSMESGLRNKKNLVAISKRVHKCIYMSYKCYRFQQTN